MKVTRFPYDTVKRQLAWFLYKLKAIRVDTAYRDNI
jgi:hypothetical protein